MWDFRIRGFLHFYCFEYNSPNAKTGQAASGVLGLGFRLWVLVLGNLACVACWLVLGMGFEGFQDVAPDPNPIAAGLGGCYFQDSDLVSLLVLLRPQVSGDWRAFSPIYGSWEGRMEV